MEILKSVLVLIALGGTLMLVTVGTKKLKNRLFPNKKNGGSCCS